MAEEQGTSFWMIYSATELRVDYLTVLVVLETLGYTIVIMPRMLESLALLVSTERDMFT